MLNKTVTRSIACLILLCPCVAMGEEVDFNRDVRPILSGRCFACHGADAASREASLRLDELKFAIKPAESGEPAIVPGDVGSSELIVRITANDPDLKMPPADSPKQLSEKQIATLTAWIEQGAEYKQHWAFVRAKEPALPKVANPSWPKNKIDHFVMEQLSSARLSPALEASRETLIRRVAFDLTGLPPTIQEVDDFLADAKSGAYERMVDHYLDSTAYGEHMARHWLDLARYADTNGYQYDTERTQWVWRDWVINAYNQNKPFDVFTIEQLAGDLLQGGTPQQRLATGFNRNHGITIEGGIIDEEYRTEYVMDRLLTTGAVWLGLTVGCGRCHEHKYDPISQPEFYQLYAFFNQVPERGMRGFTPQERIASPLAASQQRELDAELARLRKELSEPAHIDLLLKDWVKKIADSPYGGWETLTPLTMTSTGGSKLTRLDDNSIVVGGANPRKDNYEITAKTKSTGLTAVRLEALTHESLPGGGPGRHSNSNFVLSEFELTAVSLKDPSQSRQIKFRRAIADYSQAGYEVAKAIDGAVADNNGWAVDGPTRKENATAMFIAETPFGFDDGTELRFRLRHEANFATHGVGRPRISITRDGPDTIRLQGLSHEIRKLASAAAQSGKAAKRLRDYFVENYDPRKLLIDRIAQIEKQKTEAFPSTMIMQDMAQRRKTHVLNRGQYNEPTELVTAGVPAVFPPLPKDAPANRLGFARWLVDPSHPLTSRVAVNRYWQRLFGIGLVKTSEDFGVQGELPSHPKLLDWLSLEFVRSGWDVKQIQRLMINSATYRQTSHVGKAAYLRDPENRLLSRGPRMRLDGEEVRDAALAASGLLVQRLGGKSVYPYQPKGLWMELNNRPGYSREYARGRGDDLYRRSLYTFWKRSVPSPMLKTFDAPEREFCTIRRSRTNTPLQALLLLNGPQFVEAARRLGERMIQHGGEETEQRISFGFRLVTARTPSESELTLLREVYDAELERFTTDREALTRVLEVGDSPVDGELKRAELAAFASIARLLLNLNEAITKG